MNGDYKRRSSLLIITHKFALIGEAAISTKEDGFLASARVFINNSFLEKFVGILLQIFPGSLAFFLPTPSSSRLLHFVYRQTV